MRFILLVTFSICVANGVEAGRQSHDMQKVSCYVLDGGIWCKFSLLILFYCSDFKTFLQTVDDSIHTVPCTRQNSVP